LSDAPTFRRIYDEHVRMVYNLCMDHLRDVEEAQEATQDVFLKVHTALHTFAGDAQLRTWIYRIAVNTCLDRIKAARRRKRSFLTRLFQHDEPSRDVPGTDHPGVELEEREAMAGLFRAIDALPDAQRTALLLKAMEGLSQQEIAAVMVISEKAVESLLSRARSALRQRPKD
jgi:RNA polymerase sigma-70 factor (ECF subfamily)